MMEITYNQGRTETFDSPIKAREEVICQALNGYAVHVEIDDSIDAYQLHNQLARVAHIKDHTFIRDDGDTVHRVKSKRIEGGLFKASPAPSGGHFVYYC